MKRSEFNKGEYLYGIPDSEASKKYNPEGERVFIHDGYITGDGYGKLIGWHSHQIKHSSGHGNFQWGGEVRKATEEEIDEFNQKLMNQETIYHY